MYLKRYHDVEISQSGVWRILHRLDMGRLPASQRYKRRDLRRKRLGISTGELLAMADALNRVRAVDFQFGATADGQSIKIVSIVDEHTRACLGSLVERLITGEALIEKLDLLAIERGYLAVLRSGNGPEFACAALREWAGERIGLAPIPSGGPWRNGYVELFNGRIPDECLNITLFWSLTRARVVISDWKDEYNHQRRHSSLTTRPRPVTPPTAPHR